MCKIAGGAGASPPSSASALGDTVHQRLERILGYANATYPGRCIDPAPLAVQAATDIGGQQAGQNLTDIAQSDGGLLFVDNLGNLTYWQKTHLAAQYSSPVWTFQPGRRRRPVPLRPRVLLAGRPAADLERDHHHPVLSGRGDAAAGHPAELRRVQASQQQYGAQPRQFTSYLQSTAEMQSQANWLFSEFGTLRMAGAEHAGRRGILPGRLATGPRRQRRGDVISVQNWQISRGGGATGTFRHLADPPPHLFRRPGRPGRRQHRDQRRLRTRYLLELADCFPQRKGVRRNDYTGQRRNPDIPAAVASWCASAGGSRSAPDGTILSVAGTGNSAVITVAFTGRPAANFRTYQLMLL